MDEDFFFLFPSFSLIIDWQKRAARLRELEVPLTLRQLSVDVRNAEVIGLIKVFFEILDPDS